MVQSRGSSRLIAAGPAVITVFVAARAFAATQPPAHASTPRPQFATVQLTLRDARSRRPVANADVRWRVGRHVETGTTNADGRLSFVVGRPEPYSADRGRERRRRQFERVGLSITANLYRHERRQLRIRPGETQHLDVELYARRAHEVGVLFGMLTNADNGKGIANADVALEGAGASLATRTDADGVFHIARIGFSRLLRLRISTKNAPCIEPIERPVVVERSAVAILISATDLRLPVVHCPAALFGGVGRVGGGPLLPSDGAVHWHQADLLTIQMSENDDAWHAGHVNDILKLEPESGMLVATDTGGVWAITRIGQAIPLSDTWPAVYMAAFAAGPDGSRHVYAGSQSLGPNRRGVLWETDTSTGVPTLNWRMVSPAPPCAQIDDVLVIPEVRRIVLACDTGIKWSVIPPAPSASKPYTWIDATPANLQQGAHFSALAKGPGWTRGAEGTIVAAKWGGFAPGTAIYHGGWSGGTLRLGFSTVDQGAGNLFLSMGRTSLASCAGNPQLMFAVAEDGANNMVGTWRSDDGGVEWRQVTMPSNPGVQGNYNNVIAVSQDCRIVALGWQAGTFVSYDSGQSWTLLSGAPHVHGDVHALTFDPADPSTLFIGSDGGVLSASALGPGRTPTFQSNWNRQLLDLQFYHDAAGTTVNGFVAGGLQDNGVVFGTVPGPWRHLTDCGCDGRWTRFIRPPDIGDGTSILLDEEFGAPDWPFSSIRANGSTIAGNTTTIPVVPSNPKELTDVVTSPVTAPAFSNAAGQPMFAVGGTGTDAYGLFADNNGDNLHWERLGGIGGGQKISAISPTFNGRTVFVGTDAGNILRFDAPYNQSPIQLGMNIPSGAKGARQVSGLVAFFAGVALATVNIGGSGYVMSLADQVWSSVAGALPHALPFKTIAAADLRSIFVATDTAVYDTHDVGGTWNNASNGLPSVITANDLQIATGPDGGTFVYLATFGRSLWRAQLP